jgi:hypothetical protein
MATIRFPERRMATLDAPLSHAEPAAMLAEDEQDRIGAANDAEHLVRGQDELLGRLHLDSSLRSVNEPAGAAAFLRE